jgi:tetratricopeptide (TPR) repeat protein
VDNAIVDWLISVLNDYKGQGPVARISFVLAVGALCTGAFALLYRWRRSGFERLESEIEELKRRLESATARVGRLDDDKRQLEAHLAAISARDCWNIVRRAEQERNDGNEEPALSLFRQVVENNAPTLAHASLQLAQAHLSAFAESDDVEHLAAAERYARISRLLDRSPKQALGLLSEIEAASGHVAADLRDFDAAGRHWDEADIFSRSAHGLAGQDLVARLTEVGWRNRGDGHYYTALALARRATLLGERELPTDSVLRLAAESLLGVCLWHVGEYAAARERLEIVLAKQKQMLGRDHLDTLMTDDQLGICLMYMGEYSAARKRLGAVLAALDRVLVVCP